MALPIAHPLDEVTVHGAALDCSTGKAVIIRAPFKGTLKESGTMLGSVLSTADATATLSIAGTAVTGGSWVITQSGSAIGDLDAAAVSGVVANGVTANSTITGANTCLEGDVIKIALTGSGTAGGILMGYATIRRG